MTPDQILALAGALLAAEPSPAAFPGPDGIGADPRYPVTATPCQRPLAPYELEGRTIFCGEVRVPADHSTPEGPTIGLGFAVLKAKSLSPAPDPLVFLQGGPGATVVDALQGFAGMFQDWRIRRDVITFDQRGNGVSNELTACHAATGAHLVALVKQQAGKGGDTPSEDVARACREELASRASPVSLINTEQNARDVAALMSALGYAEWNFYGGSYGTKLGLEVLRQNP